MNNSTTDSSAASLSTSPPIIPREKLDFGLSGDIPKYWFDNNPFKTRMFDAMSTVFPEGERYFIACVRDFRDQITDPKLLADIRDFMRQEGQHGVVHTAYNDRLTAQGINVESIEKFARTILYKIFRKRFSPKTTLAHTAALEHLTASLADTLFANPQVAQEMDHRMHALYVWHAMEEVEHKSVAFDVMQKVAKVGYFRRVFVFLIASIIFPVNILNITHRMLWRDGFTFLQRLMIIIKGAWWLYKPSGLLWGFWRPYFAYIKPGFHPWHKSQVASYQLWAKVMGETGDPIAARQAIVF